MGAGVDSDNWISNTSGETIGRYVSSIDDEIRIEQNLIDTYARVVTIKKHGVVSL